MKLTLDELSAMHRSLGTIEGAAYGTGERERVIYEAITNINWILEKAEVEKC